MRRASLLFITGLILLIHHNTLVSHAYVAGLCGRTISGLTSSTSIVDICDLQVALTHGDWATLDQYIEDSAPVSMVTFSNNSVMSLYGTWHQYSAYLKTVDVGSGSELDQSALFTTTDCFIYGTIQGIEYSRAHLLCKGDETQIGDIVAQTVSTQDGESVLRRAEVGYALTLDGRSLKRGAVLADNSSVPSGGGNDVVAFGNVNPRTVNGVEILTDFAAINQTYPKLYGNGARAFCDSALAACPGYFAKTEECLAFMDARRLFDIDGVVRTTGQSAACVVYQFYYGGDGEGAKCAAFNGSQTGVCMD